MWTKLTIIGCLLLTAVVVHTAVRIEHVNHQMGTFLPRAPGLERVKWEVPELEDVLEYVDGQIARQRSNLFALEHPDDELPPPENFMGAPYSPRELGFIDRHKRDHAIFSELHWWVYSFGALQYGLAPLALVWSVGNVLAIRKVQVRALCATCAALALCAIFLMIVRGY